jgi:hypothetical protein
MARACRRRAFEDPFPDRVFRACRHVRRRCRRSRRHGGGGRAGPGPGAVPHPGPPGNEGPQGLRGPAHVPRGGARLARGGPAADRFRPGGGAAGRPVRRAHARPPPGPPGGADPGSPRARIVRLGWTAGRHLRPAGPRIVAPGLGGGGHAADRAAPLGRHPGSNGRALFPLQRLGRGQRRPGPVRVPPRRRLRPPARTCCGSRAPPDCRPCTCSGPSTAATTPTRTRGCWG